MAQRANRQHLPAFRVSRRNRYFQTTSLDDYLSPALDFLSEGIEVSDANGVIRYVNRAFSRISGVPLSMRLGRNIFDINPEGDLSLVLRTGQPIYRGKPGQGDILVACHPLWQSGQSLAGAVLILQDANLPSPQREDRSTECPQVRDVVPNAARYTFADLAGKSSAFAELIYQSTKAARSNSTILITGESGTGKEVLAHAIHHASPRRNGPFIAVNCAALPEHLLESEFFGYEKGAFTGADRRKIGLFELARNGTIFLDEIGEMSLSLQAKLLRVLQDKAFYRLGGSSPIHADVRVIAATNAHLKALVADQKFRGDLYYRLNVVRLHLPPLRERLDDLPELVEAILRRLAAKMDREPPQITPEAMNVLSTHQWPGNVRELENVLERALNFLLPGEGHIGSKLITFPDEESPRGRRETAVPPLGIRLPTLQDMERTLIQLALECYGKSGQGKRQAAQTLGISLTTLYDRIKRYGMNDWLEGEQGSV